MTVHGRSREGRYYTTPDWDYLDSCVAAQTSDHPRIPVFGNGDVYNWDDWVNHLHIQDEASEKAKEVAELLERTEQQREAAASNSNEARLSGCMLGRGALIKPWVCIVGFACCMLPLLIHHLAFLHFCIFTLRSKHTSIHICACCCMYVVALY